MSTTEAALTVSLFAAMAALQFGGSHAAHIARGAPAAPTLSAVPVIDTAGWADSAAQVVQDLAAAGMLEDPDTQGMRVMAAAVTPTRP
jgi:hypothetical protein